MIFANYFQKISLYFSFLLKTTNILATILTRNALIKTSCFCLRQLSFRYISSVHLRLCVLQLQQPSAGVFFITLSAQCDTLAFECWELPKKIRERDYFSIIVKLSRNFKMCKGFRSDYHIGIHYTFNAVYRHQ